MDVGTFKASKARLITWIVIPPVLILAVGLSSYALRQRAEWRLKQTELLVDVLPEVIQAQTQVRQLFEELGLSAENRIATEDELISLLQEKARKRNITIETVQVKRREKSKDGNVPVLSTMVEASGDFTAFKLYLNDIRSTLPLVSANTITLSLGRNTTTSGEFNLKVLFELLLVDEVLKTSGGSQ